MLAPILFLVAAAASAPPQFEARMREGMTALGQNNLTKAQTSFEQATRLAPKDPRAWLLLAQTYAKQKNEKSALAAAQKSELLGGEDPRILQGLANFYATLVPDLPKAAKMGELYAEKASQDTTAWMRLAQFCLSAGLPDQAIAAGTRALAHDNTAETHTIIGNAWLVRKDYSKAQAELNEALKLKPYDEDSHFRLAQAYLVAQDFPSAVKVLQDSRKIFDKSPQIELALGVAYYGQRQFPEAIAQFIRTIDLAPDVPQPYVFLGRMMDHLTDRLPEITARFAQFEARNPKSPLGYLLHAKGIIAQLPATGFPPEAATALELVQKSLALEDKDAEAHYQMGVLLDRRKDYQDAATHLERSIQLNAKDSAVHFRLARVYDRLGRKEDAAREREIHEKLNLEEKPK